MQTGQAQVAIEIERVGVVFNSSSKDRVKALDDVSLEIYANEFFTLLGPSGCGKTTLLRSIAGFEQPTTGSIKLEGQPLEGLPPFKRPVNTVFQSYALFPHLTVAQNIAFGLEESRKPKLEISRRVEEMLNLVKLEGFAARKPAQLSGGQQQRVALARALANSPKVLLLDESLSALDLKLRKEMQLELKRLQHATGITFVFVTHDQEEALTMSDRLAVMKDGRIEQIGTPTEIYDHPRSKYVADFIGETNFLEGRVFEGRVKIGHLQLELPVEAPEGTSVQLAVRPERATISSEAGGLAGRVSNVIYMGSDTVYHLELTQGSNFKVRVPNAVGATRAFQIGDAVNLMIPASAVQVLES
jgi:spermidine/putrescine transport system ATP-binding protein